MRILGLCGSLRKGSHSGAILRGAAHLLGDDVELVTYDELAAVPLYDQDLDDQGAPHAVERLRAAVAEADALLVVTPEHNGSLSAALKNAIDWASRPTGAAPLAGKPAVVLGSSVSPFGAVWAQNAARRVLGLAGARVIGDEEIPIGPMPDAIDERGVPRDAAIAERVQSLLGQLRAELEPAVA